VFFVSSLFFFFFFCPPPPPKPGGGMWCPVSGRVEPGESQPAAVAREVREELGVAAVAVRHLDSVLTGDGAFRLQYWRTEIHGEPLLANDEATALRWLDAHEVRALHPTFPEDVAICERELRAPREEGRP
jgi:8-oxo-dGTP diphosphatase